MDSKAAVASKGLWSNLVGGIVSVAAIVIAKTHLTPEEANTIIAPLVVSLIGHIFGFISRYQANSQITGVFIKK